jgi:uncharacterized protein
VTVVAVVSDTHMPRGERRLPETCLERLRRADLILHAGDFVTLAVLEHLRALGPPVEGVHGNGDEPALRAVLPERRIVEIGDLRIGLVHAPGPRVGRHARLAASFPGCAAVIYGHTHAPELERIGDVWMLNPGSPTERRRSRSRSMLELRIADGRLEPRLEELS